MIGFGRGDKLEKGGRPVVRRGGQKRKRQGSELMNVEK